MHIVTPLLPTSLVQLIRRIIHVLTSISLSTPLSTTTAPAASEATKRSSKTKDDATTVSPSPLATLLANPTLFSPLRVPRLPIILCHGLYGFDVLGFSSFPTLQLHYWNSVLEVLRDKLGAEVIVTGVSSTGLISDRAEQMDKYLQSKVGGKEFNFIAHSMGGLDCRYLISSLKPASRSSETKAKAYYPRSLTTLSTPHRGSPFMDWCMANIGIGVPRPRSRFPNGEKTHPESSSQRTGRDTKEQEEDELMLNPSPSHPHSSSMRSKLPYSLRTPLLPRPSPSTPYPMRLLSPESYSPNKFSLPALLLSLLDSPAYSNLTTDFLRVFNERVLDDPDVKYFSVAARKDRSKMGIWHPLWFPKVIVDEVEEANSQLQENIFHTSSPALKGNDGLVPVSSAQWGQFLGVVDNCDHWELRGGSGLSRLNLNFNFGGSVTDALNWDEWRQRFIPFKNKDRETESQKVDEKDGDVQALTKRLNAVVDWIVDKPGNPKSPSQPLPEAVSKPIGSSSKKGEKEASFDFERFYVALCRKLYDEGL